MLKKAFTITELVFVIIILGILAAVAVPYLKTNNKFETAMNNFRYNFYQYEMVASQDNKYKIVPDNSSDIYNTEYWFKRRLQLVFQYKNGKLFYYIFQDSSPFDTKLSSLSEIYSNGAKYYIGVSSQEMGSSVYPPSWEIDKTFNLSNYGVIKMKICVGASCEYIPQNTDKFRLIFFNNNIFLNEVTGTSDVPLLLTSERKIDTKNIYITFYSDNGQSKTFKINPEGVLSDE